MSDTESIFNPLNDSLIERVRAYCSVAKAYADLKANIASSENGEYQNWIGEKQQLDDAHLVLESSFELANQSVSLSDLTDAKEKGLLNEKDIFDAVQVSHSLKISDRRNKVAKSSDQLTRKR